MVSLMVVRRGQKCDRDMFGYILIEKFSVLSFCCICIFFKEMYFYLYWYR